MAEDKERKGFQLGLLMGDIIRGNKEINKGLTEIKKKQDLQDRRIYVLEVRVYVILAILLGGREVAGWVFGL